MSKKDKRDLIFLALFALFLIVAFIFFVINDYNKANIQREDLTLVNDKFVSYKKQKNYGYRMQCESGKIYNIDYKVMDEAPLLDLKENDELILYVRGDSVFEAKVNDRYLLKLEDAKTKYASEATTTTIVVSSIFAGLIILTPAAFLIAKAHGKKVLLKREQEWEELERNVDTDIYNEIINSVHEDNGVKKIRVFRHFNEEMNDIPTHTAYKAIMDLIDEDEIVFMIDEDDEVPTFFYKLGRKLFYETAYSDEMPYCVDLDLYWCYPIYENTTEEEIKRFEKAKDKFLLMNENLIDEKCL